MSSAVAIERWRRAHDITHAEVVRRWMGLPECQRSDPSFVNYVADGWMYWRDRALDAEMILLEASER